MGSYVTEMRRNSAGPTFRHKTKVQINQNPGPADYKASVPKYKAPASFVRASKPELFVSKSTQNLPGPASYEVKTGFVPKKVTIFLPSFSKMSLTPGVCHYDVKPVLKHKPYVKMATS